MRRMIVIATLVATWALVGFAGEPEPLVWTHQGYKSLVEAAAKAQQEEQMLLIGLSGGDT